MPDAREHNKLNRSYPPFGRGGINVDGDARAVVRVES